MDAKIKSFFKTAKTFNERFPITWEKKKCTTFRCMIFEKYQSGTIV